MPERLYIATRQFTVGDHLTRVENGDQILFDGQTVRHGGKTFDLELWVGAIKVGWLREIGQVIDVSQDAKTEKVPPLYAVWASQIHVPGEPAREGRWITSPAFHWEAWVKLRAMIPTPYWKYEVLPYSHTGPKVERHTSWEVILRDDPPV
jgi:hypothetical protein